MEPNKPNIADQLKRRFGGNNNAGSHIMRWAERTRDNKEDRMEVLEAKVDALIGLLGKKDEVETILKLKK